MLPSLIKHWHDYIQAFGIAFRRRNDPFQVLVMIVRAHGTFFPIHFVGNAVIKTIHKDKNIIGSYNVFYDDGTKESIPMEYSKTVGFDRISRTYEEQDWCYSNKTDRRILDTGYSSGLIFRGEMILYKYVIPSEKAISRVEIDVKDEFKKFVEIEEITYS